MSEPALPEACDPYAALAKPDRVWLRRAAAQLRAHLGRTVREIVDCGATLRKARLRLGRDRWPAWLSGEAQIARRTAYRFMGTAATFGSLEKTVLDRFSPGALYALADRGCPVELREYAINRAEEGTVVTRAAVEEWTSAFRDAPAVVSKLVQITDAAPPKPEGGVSRAPENWRLLCELVGTGDNSVHISQLRDCENGETTVSVVVLPQEGKHRSATAPTLEEAVMEAAGVRREKMCKGPCGETKSLYQFSHAKGAKDGRNKYCLVCERARVKAYLKRKSAEAKAG